MGKQSGKKKKQSVEKSGDATYGERSKVGDSSPRAYDGDTMVFISMAQELKEEGNKLFQKRDIEGAVLKYEKALKLLPGNHIDVSCLRSNMAACYMQMGHSEYPRAINECNLALEVTPKYSKALLKRAKCYEALNRLDLAFRDVSTVLNMEPNNVMALEISERLKEALEERGLKVNDTVIELPPDYVAPPPIVVKVKKPKKKNKKVGVKKAENGIEEEKVGDQLEEKSTEENLEEKREEVKEVVEEKKQKKKSKQLEGKKAKNKIQEKKPEEQLEEKNTEENLEERKDEVKEVVEEKINSKMEDIPKKTVKLVFGEDIRWAELPLNCTFFQLREVVHERFPAAGAVLVKYRDQEGDLVTVTSDEELRWAEASVESPGSVRLFIVEVSSEQDPFFEKFENKREVHKFGRTREPDNGYVASKKEMTSLSCIEDWIIQFAQLFKNHVGFESDRYLDLHELGMKVYAEAMEETATSEEAQGLFDMAGNKFQELAALALFNWGNVHMSRARKRLYVSGDSSKENIISRIKDSYDWAQSEYRKAGEKYKEAVKIRPDFYEGFLALGQQQFEQAKLSWYYAISNGVDLETWPSTEVLQIYNSAEDNMEKGMQKWEELEEQRQSETSNSKDVKTELQKLGLDGLIPDIPQDETAEQVENMRSHINLLWGSMLYERSIGEFKLGLPVWQECLEVAIEKFELAGVSPSVIAVMVKNHCSNSTAVEGFKIDEIVQAWSDLCEAKQMQNGIPSFRLETLFRRRVSKLYHAMEIS